MKILEILWRHMPTQCLQ